jgi:tellurite resistance protein
MMTTRDVSQGEAEGNESWLAHFPVTFFAVVMGLSGLTLATHRIELKFAVSHTASLALTAITTLVFLAISTVFLAKALRYPASVRDEWNHPIRIAFFPAITIGALLIAAAILPWNRPLAHGLWLAAAVAHLGVILGVVAAWLSHRPFETVHLTPAWFIPAVGNVLVPMAGVKLGYIEVSWFFFSVGMLFWLVFLTLVFNRLIFHNPLPERLLPTLVIVIAPPSVGFVAWQELNGGEIDAFARILYYSALMFVLITLTQVGRLVSLPFTMSWWAYSFPVAGFTIASSRFGEATGTLVPKALTLVSYAVLCAIILLLVLKTIAAMRRDEICRPEG